MDKIVSLCKRRGFIFPASEIYGGIANTYDYGHYGVLLKQNVIEPVVEGDDPGPRRHRRAGLGDHPAPAHVGGERASRRLHRPARRSASASASGGSARTICARRPRRAASRPSTSAARSASGELSEPRDVQPDVRDDDRPGEGGGLDRLPAARDRAGHLPRLQAGAAVRAPQAAVRDRAGRQVVPQRDHARQLHLPHARVRADGDGVLRPARRGRRSGTSTGCASASTGTCGSASIPSTCACARTTRTSCRTTRPRTSDVEYLYPIGWSELEGIANRGDFDLTQHAKFSGEKLD